ncbi:hypothetical protein AB0I87_05715, partial [Streptomyces sp. NPDC049952]
MPQRLSAGPTRPRNHPVVLRRTRRTPEAFWPGGSHPDAEILIPSVREALPHIVGLIERART